MTVELAPESTPETPSTEIAKDLEHSLLSLKSVVSIINLLTGGQFEYKLAHGVPQALLFLTALYKDLKDTCLGHPDMDKIPELLDLKAREDAEAKAKETPVEPS